MSSARELMRQKEDLYKTLHLADSQLSEEALIQALVEHPKLMGAPHCGGKWSGAHWPTA
ncbi:arsenate reductase (arsenical pump modifier) [Salmonella enterica subsp. enterica]|uniref:Arsenate reductase (Arsenical pump modifier) n=1 Tax=Salmonella enterica I TaxID=59201 RepID=A0A447N6L3_SALET|nr:arsenate reductase (arsenical pump modifier) [Salmonella enterica subsp. enterica]